MSDNRAETRATRHIQRELNLPYAASLRLLRMGLVIIVDGQVVDKREDV